MVVVVLILLVLPHFKKNKSKISSEQIESVILKIKENGRHKKEGGIVKKKVVVSNEGDKELKNADRKEDDKNTKTEDKKDDETIEGITNVMLKFKILEDTYQERLKNKKINYKRVSKYGDVVYYENEIMLNSQYSKNPIMHLVIKLEDGDFISRQLVGKKVGEVSIYTQKEMANAYFDESTEYGRQAKAKLEELDKQNEVMPTTKVIYKVKIIDFVQNETMKKLSLDNNL